MDETDKQELQGLKGALVQLVSLEQMAERELQV